MQGRLGRDRGAQGRALAISSALLAVLVAPVAVAAIDGGEAHESASGRSRSYVQRTTNLREGDGGAAVFGCRARTNREACVRATNLRTGRAFHFSTNGAEGGRIVANAPGARPFTTNATGVATGLNADRVDSLDANDLVAGRRFPQIRLTGGQTQELFAAGPVTLTARCRIDDSGLDVAEVLIATTQDGVAFEGEDVSINLTTQTDEDDRQLAAVQTGHNNVAFDASDTVGAMAPDGTSLTGRITTGVNLFGTPGTCFFGGFIAAG